MKTKEDYSVVQGKLIATYNAIIALSKNINPKNKVDDDCRALGALCVAAASLQSTIDEFVAEVNNNLRKGIKTELLASGMKEFEIDNMFESTYGVKLYEANNKTLREYIANFRKTQSSVSDCEPKDKIN